MHYYRLTLSHDKGRIRLRVFAASVDAAIRIVMACEGCPRGAILHAEPCK